MGNLLSTPPVDTERIYTVPIDQRPQPEIRDVWTKYTKIKELGAGEFGTAYLAKKDGKEFVVKIMPKGDLDSIQNEAEREFWTGRKVEDCPSAIQYIDVFPIAEDTWAVVQEYFNGISLQQYMDHESEPMTPVMFIGVARDLLLGLKCIHDHGIMHGDIHPGNIMYDGTDLKYIDFGIACVPDGIRWACWASRTPQRDLEDLNNVFERILSADKNVRTAADTYLARYPECPLAQKIHTMVTGIRNETIVNIEQALEALNN